MTEAEKEKAALAAIKSMVGKTDGEYSVALFVEHHLDEIEAQYFIDTYGTPKPDHAQVIGSLILVSSWSSEDDENIDVFDFSLPGIETDYLLSVRFSGDEIVEIDMES